MLLGSTPFAVPIFEKWNHIGLILHHYCINFFLIRMENLKRAFLSVFSEAEIYKCSTLNYSLGKIAVKSFEPGFTSGGNLW
jgi:hypothetical protein